MSNTPLNTSNTFIVSTINLAFETYTLSSYSNLNVKIIVRFHSGGLIAFNYSRNIYIFIKIVINTKSSTIYCPLLYLVNCIIRNPSNILFPTTLHPVQHIRLSNFNLTSTVKETKTRISNSILHWPQCHRSEDRLPSRFEDLSWEVLAYPAHLGTTCLGIRAANRRKRAWVAKLWCEREATAKPLSLFSVLPKRSLQRSDIK